MSENLKSIFSWISIAQKTNEILKPNYFKKQSSSSSYIRVQVQTSLLSMYSIAILNLYYLYLGK
jgi:hypothetical protein